MSMSKIISLLRKQTTNSICNSTPQSSSVSCVGTSTGVHHFEIRNYSLTKGCGVRTAIHSTTFTVGEHDWRISCYLDGNNETSSDYISVFLLYCPKPDGKTRVKFTISLLDHATGAVQHRPDYTSVNLFSSFSKELGWDKFIARNVLEASSYLRNDTLTIICNVTIIGEPQIYDSRNVNGQSFPTHRNLVAASSDGFVLTCPPQLSSVSRVGTSNGVHHFEIHNYSLTKGRGFGTNILSTTFTVGEHDWRIKCYLDGDMETSSDYISVFLMYCPKSDEKARVKFSLSLLDHSTGGAQHRLDNTSVQLFSSSSKILGWKKFIRRNVLEASSYLRNDSLTIICNVTIIGEPQTYYSRVPRIVKPSTLYKQLGTLMSVEKGADINFEVDGHCYHVHRSVVAASSPVFRAHISSMFKEAKESSIKITNIEAPVFEALLLYIYTDNLPEIETLTDTGMAQHLLEAADRFALVKLRRSCETKLCEGLDVRNVCTALALADQHSLSTLKGACLEYLSSPKALVSSMATDGFIHLIKSCPSIAKEIFNKINVSELK